MFAGENRKGPNQNLSHQFLKNKNREETKIFLLWHGGTALLNPWPRVPTVLKCVFYCFVACAMQCFAASTTSTIGNSNNSVEKTTHPKYAASSETPPPPPTLLYANHNFSPYYILQHNHYYILLHRFTVGEIKCNRKLFCTSFKKLKKHKYSYFSLLKIGRCTIGDAAFVK